MNLSNIVKQYPAKITHIMTTKDIIEHDIKVEFKMYGNEYILLWKNCGNHTFMTHSPYTDSVTYKVMELYFRHTDFIITKIMITKELEPGFVSLL